MRRGYMILLEQIALSELGLLVPMGEASLEDMVLARMSLYIHTHYTA